MAILRMTGGRARLLADAAALAAFVLSYLVIPLRLGHLAAGYAVAVVVLTHLAQHGPAALRGLASPGAGRRRAIADTALFALVALTTASGVWQQVQPDGASRGWHSTLGTVTLLAALGHTWRRRHVMLGRRWRARARARARARQGSAARRSQRPATGAGTGVAAGEGAGPCICRSRS
jgi:hypothetical protein